VGKRITALLLVLILAFTAFSVFVSATGLDNFQIVDTYVNQVEEVPSNQWYVSHSRAADGKNPTALHAACSPCPLLCTCL